MIEEILDKKLLLKKQTILINFIRKMKKKERKNKPKEKKEKRTNKLILLYILIYLLFLKYYEILKFKNIRINILIKIFV